MRKHHAFRRSGRPRGEENQRRIAMRRRVAGRFGIASSKRRCLALRGARQDTRHVGEGDQPFLRATRQAGR